MSGLLEEAIERIVLEAEQEGSTIYTDEAVKALRRRCPDLRLSSRCLTDTVVMAAAARRVPLRIIVPLEII